MQSLTEFAEDVLGFKLTKIQKNLLLNYQKAQEEKKPVDIATARQSNTALLQILILYTYYNKHEGVLNDNI